MSISSGGRIFSEGLSALRYGSIQTSDSITCQGKGACTSSQIQSTGSSINCDGYYACAGCSIISAADYVTKKKNNFGS